MACTRSAINARLSPPAAAHSAETASPHPAETGIREPRLRLRSEARLRLRSEARLRLRSEARLRCGSEITSGAEAGDHRRRSHPVCLTEIAAGHRGRPEARRRGNTVGFAEITSRAETRHSRSRSDAVRRAREGMTATEAVRQRRAGVRHAAAVHRIVRPGETPLPAFKAAETMPVEKRIVHDDRSAIPTGVR